MFNPYITEFPTDPKFFAGRCNEIKQLERAIDYTIHSQPPTPHNIAIVGDWGIGKTSLLNKCIELSLGKRCFACRITLTPAKCKNLEAFVYDTIDEIHTAIWDSGLFTPKIKEKISEWKIESLKFLGVEVKREIIKSTPSALLKKSLLNLWRNIKIPSVIMYDDLHYLAESYPKGLYDLRGVFQELRGYGCRLMLICTGVSTLFSEIRGISEPLIRFFDHIELKEFTLAETKEAISLPLNNLKIRLEFTKDVIKEIYKKSNGHPCFVMFFAHDIFEHKQKGRITLGFFNTIYKKIFAHIAAARFMKDLAIASDKEKKVLFRAARLKDEFDIKDLKTPNIGVHLARLVDKNLLTKIERGKYRFYHPLFREYLRSVT